MTHEYADNLLTTLVVFDRNFNLLCSCEDITPHEINRVKSCRYEKEEGMTLWITDAKFEEVERRFHGDFEGFWRYLSNVAENEAALNSSS